MKAPEVMALLHTTSDAELVAACLGGNHSAFEQIVVRYQRLLCSVAYSALGDVRTSEDAAQETFLTAWTKLAELREPDRLRPWLCAILRHKVSHLRRDLAREPANAAEPLEAAGDLPGSEIPAGDAAMQREEQALVWRALATLPENYREPLVLFYREHRSIEHVAAELDLTEDAVKQRLARGRNLLKEQVLTLVEGALARSTPGRVFTVGVLAALPTLSPPAQAAATIGTAAAAVTTAGKGATGLAKVAAFAALLASVTGLVSAVISLRSNLDQARTERERRAVVRSTIGLFVSFALFLLVMFAARFVGARHPAAVPLLGWGLAGLSAAFAVAWSVWLFREMRLARELRSAERQRRPECFVGPAHQVGSAQAEYRSAAKFLGVPLVHLRFATPEAGAAPAFGWIAAGDRAIGLLFAFGGWAVGFVSVGAVSGGVVSLGAISVGVFGLGSICVGFLAIAAVAFGWHAVGSLMAAGWHIAQGPGLAFSNWIAVAPVALARHANDAFAREVFTNPRAETEWLVICVLIVVLSLGPTALYARAVRRRFGSSAPPR
jgi:RNA polymerase sigma factor (sigma-70 family)